MLKEVVVPDIGSYSNVDIIEVLVKVGDTIAKEVALITLETDKATMEIPSPYAGIIKELKVKVGDKVSAGNVILMLETSDVAASAASTPTSAPAVVQSEAASTTTPTAAATAAIPVAAPTPTPAPSAATVTTTGSAEVHAGPGARRLARELGADLTRIQGTGRKGRLLPSDVQKYVKSIVQQFQSGAGMVGGTAGAAGIGALASGPMTNIPPWPQIDHAQFGAITKEPLSRIKKLSGGFLHRNWIMVPHITQFDEADITDLEQFRKQSQALAEEGVKLTPLVFIMKAVTATLQAFPTFNASLDANASELILKKYFHIGVAVDTPNGLVVPVVRDVEQKGLFQLAKELGEISKRARQGQLKAQEMQGSSFSISSLGGIGGTAFTPIINVPDVAILGVSKAQMKPIYQEESFKPRLMLPLSLSYDHRVIDGAEAARFITYLVKQLSDIRRLLL